MRVGIYTCICIYKYKYVGIVDLLDCNCRALRALLDYLFVTLRKLRVVATVDARNTASLRLFRTLQFREEGFFVENVFFKGEWGSEVQFALLRREWPTTDTTTISSTTNNTTARATTTSATISTISSATSNNSSLLQS